MKIHEEKKKKLQTCYSPWFQVFRLWGWRIVKRGGFTQSLKFKYLYKRRSKSNELLRVLYNMEPFKSPQFPVLRNFFSGKLVRNCFKIIFSQFSNLVQVIDQLCSSISSQSWTIRVLLSCESAALIPTKFEHFSTEMKRIHEISSKKFWNEVQKSTLEQSKVRI